MTTFIVSTHHLRENLQKIQSVLPTRPSLAILNTILFTIKDNSLTLESTDMFLGISCSMPIQSSSVDARFAILGKPLIDLCKTLTSSTIECSLDGETLTLRSDLVSTVMQMQQADEFPAFPEVNGDKTRFLRKDLLDISRIVLPSVSPDSARPLLTGVLMQIGEQVSAVATDGFRLSLLKLSSVKPGWKESVVIPAKFISEVIKNITDEILEVEIAYSPDLKQVQAAIGATQITSRTLDGEYPPYEKIIPQSKSSTLVLQAEELYEQVKRAIIFAKGSMNAIQIVANREKVEIKAQSPMLGQFVATLSLAHFDGDDLQVAFNSKYLTDYLQVVDGQEISLAITDNLKPVLIRSSKDDRWIYVVMPFKLNS